MIQLDPYTVTGACIVAAGAISFYKEWKFGHDLKMLHMDEICEYMHDHGYDVRMGNYNQPYFVKDKKMYQYKEIRQLLSENRLNEIF